MPEGDTLRRAAARLAPVLEGQVVTGLWFRKLRGHRPRVGDTVNRVEAVGKYLLIRFDRGLVLHTDDREHEQRPDLRLRPPPQAVPAVQRLDPVLPGRRTDQPIHLLVPPLPADARSVTGELALNPNKARIAPH